MSEVPQLSPRRHVIRRGVLFTGTGAVIGIFFLFLETIIAVRALSTGQYGIYVLLIALVNFLVIVVDFGCKTAVTQMISSSEAALRPTLVHSTLLFRLAAVAVVAAIIWLAQDLLQAMDPSPGLVLYVRFLPLMLVVASLDELLSAMLQGFQRYRHLATAQIGRGALRLLLTILLLNTLSLGLLALIYSWIISFVASVVYQFLVLPVSKRPTFGARLLIETLRFGVPLQLTRFLWLIFRRVDVLLLGSIAGPSSAAMYEVAARIPDALQRLSESFTAVYFPTMSSLLADGRRKQAIWTLNNSLRLLSFATALGVLIAVLFSEQIVTLLFSERYAATAPAFALLMVAFHMSLLANLIGYTLTSVGHPGRGFARDLLRSAANVVGDLLLIPLYGFMGPVFATLAAVYLSQPLGVWLLRKSGVEVSIAPCVKQTLLMLTCIGLAATLQQPGLTLKLGLVALFVGLNLAMATVSHHDLGLLWPGNLLKRSELAKESLPNG